MIHMLADLQGTRRDLRYIRLRVAYYLWDPVWEQSLRLLEAARMLLLLGYESSFAGCKMY